MPYFSYCFKHLSLYGFPSGHFYHFPKRVSYTIQVTNPSYMSSMIINIQILDIRVKVLIICVHRAVNISSLDHSEIKMVT